MHGTEKQHEGSDTVDLLVELDDRLPTGRAAGKLERYDHLLAGWSVHTNRYGAGSGATARRVCVSRSRPCPGVRAQSRSAPDRVSRIRRRVSRGLGVPGPRGHPVRRRARRIRWLLRGYRVPALPPEVRVSVADGDPRVREPIIRPGHLPGSDRVG